MTGFPMATWFSYGRFSVGKRGFGRRKSHPSMHALVCLHALVCEGVCLNPSVRLSVRSSVRPSVCLSVRVHVRASKCLFAHACVHQCMRDISYF